MAKNYIDNLSEETRKGLIEKAEQGSFPGTAPLGYRHNKEKKSIEIDEKRAPLIRWMFEQYEFHTSSSAPCASVTKQGVACIGSVPLANPITRSALSSTSNCAAVLRMSS